MTRVSNPERNKIKKNLVSLSDDYYKTIYLKWNFLTVTFIFSLIINLTLKERIYFFLPLFLTLATVGLSGGSDAPRRGTFGFS